MPHALVIGGGPAGATAAATLARGHWHVTLAEAARFPRNKVCGECLSVLGSDTLTHVGIGETLDSLQPTRLSSATLVTRGGRSVTLTLPRPVMGVTRTAMDPALLAALPTTVDLRQPCRVMSVESTSTGVRAKVTGGEIEADVAVVADGKGTLPGTTATPPRPTKDLGLKAHFAGVDLPPESIHLFGLCGHYVGVAAVSDGERVVWNVAFNLPARRLVPGEAHDDLFHRLLAENPAMRRAFAGAGRIGEWKASPLPRFAPKPSIHWPAHVIPVGNAAAALEPVGGEGMGLAIASAHAAAKCIVEGNVPGALDAEYRRLWRVRRPMCRTAAVALSHRPFDELTVLLAKTVPLLGRLGMKWAGKADGTLKQRLALS